MTSIMWARDDGSAMEHCELSHRPDGHRLAGTTLVVSDGAAYEIRYSILTDPAWRTTVVGVHVRGSGRDDRAALQSDGGGSWTANGSPVPELTGCRDADLEFSPATNTLPIMRLGLDIGATAEVSSAWVRFPERVVIPITQAYTRTGEHKYRYESDAFTAELTVRPDGLVAEYGEVWRTVGASDA